MNNIYLYCAKQSGRMWLTCVHAHFWLPSLNKLEYHNVVVEHCKLLKADTVGVAIFVMGKKCLKIPFNSNIAWLQSRPGLHIFWNWSWFGFIGKLKKNHAQVVPHWCKTPEREPHSLTNQDVNTEKSTTDFHGGPISKLTDKNLYSSNSIFTFKIYFFWKQSTCGVQSSRLFSVGRQPLWTGSWSRWLV